MMNMVIGAVVGVVLGVAVLGVEVCAVMDVVVV